MKHLAPLDGIREMAIISVMLYHFSQPIQHMSGLSGGAELFARMLEGLWVGVDFFFVMSGFLITSILLKTRGDQAYFKNFYVRRLLRIFPLFYAVLLVMLVIGPALSGKVDAMTQSMQDNAFWFWTYLINWRIAYEGNFNAFGGGYMWSLAVEEQFYMLWPLVVYYGYRHLFTVSVALLAGLTLVKLALAYSGVPGASLYTMTLTHMDGLLIGSAAAAWYANRDIQAPFPLMSKALLLPAVVVIVAVMGLESGWIFYKTSTNLAIGLMSLLMCALMIAVLRCSEDHIMTKMFTLKPVMFCGKLCYGLYLLHQPVGVVVSDLFVAQIQQSPVLWTIITLLISTSLSLLVAWVSFHLFEKQFLKLKRFFASPSREQAVPQTAS